MGGMRTSPVRRVHFIYRELITKFHVSHKQPMGGPYLVQVQGIKTWVMTTPRLIWQRESNLRPFSIWGLRLAKQTEREPQGESRRDATAKRGTKCGEKHFPRRDAENGPGSSQGIVNKELLMCRRWGGWISGRRRALHHLKKDNPSLRGAAKRPTSAALCSPGRRVFCFFPDSLASKSEVRNSFGWQPIFCQLYQGIGQLFVRARMSVHSFFRLRQIAAGCKLFAPEPPQCPGNGGRAA